MTLPLTPAKPTTGGTTDQTAIVGVADSESSRGAVRWAARRASITGGAVSLLHAEERKERPRSGNLGPLGHMGLPDLLTRELRFVHSVAPGVSVRTERVHGNAMWALGAASGGAQMVVVGTHKSGFIHGTVYGSRSLQLAATASCPVVVVPTRSVDGGDGIVLGADDSAAGRAALDFAAAEAVRLRTNLLIVRVWTTYDTGDDRTDGAADASARDGATVLLREFRASVTTRHPRAAVDVRAIEGSTARVLVTLSAEAQLLVLGDSRSEVGHDPITLGTVCHDALMNIQAPTVIVHAARRGPA